MSVQVMYSQLVVFNPDLDRPFNTWCDMHVNQGFSWRPGSVSFRVDDEQGAVLVEVHLVKKLPLVNVISDQVIEVPFSVGRYGIEVGSVMSSDPVSVPNGDYTLRAEFDSESRKARLFFSTDEHAEFRVVKLSFTDVLPAVLKLEAEPA